MDRNDLNGFLFVDKEKGLTSHDVVYRLRKILQTKKIGHAGTLDPLATGLLIVGIGFGTKFLQLFETADKKYEVTAKLGQVSDSYDSLGKIDTGFIPTVDFKNISLDLADKALKTFLGKSMQTPPIFSALKIKGKKAYELARKGMKVELKKREIQVFGISKINLKDNLLKFTVHCSKGTYIRSLVHDLGIKLGTGALVSALRRVKIGDIDIKRADLLSEIEKDKIIPIDQILKFFRYECTDNEFLTVKNGGKIHIDQFFTDKKVLIYFENKLISYAEFDCNGQFLVPKKVFV